MATRANRIVTNFIRWHVPPVLDDLGNVVTPGKWVVNEAGSIERPEIVDRYSEDVGPFEQDATYIISVWINEISQRFDITVLGRQLAGPGATRQPNAPLEDIAKLPTFYAVAPVVPPQ